MYIPQAKFALWCDFIEREFLQDGFRKLIDAGIINGATSNPAIFKNAFLGSPAYAEQIKSLRGQPPKTIYEALAIKDIQISADLLLPLYEEEDDGFISIEVDPSLCDDMEGTIEEGSRLFEAIGRSNVMIKVPATEAGYGAMERLMGAGIHVNATLIFSPEQAQKALEAMRRGSEAFGKAHANRGVPNGVISIFVSRFDRKMDAHFASVGIPTAKLGIYNATRIYRAIENAGLPNVRALFASTGVKGDGLSPDYYVTKLLYANCINTAPLETIDAFVATGIKSVKEPIDASEIDAFFQLLQEKEIDMGAIYDTLLEEGLEAFKIAFREILKELEKG